MLDTLSSARGLRGGPARGLPALVIALSLSFAVSLPAAASPWSARANVAVATMLSKDQVGPLHYDTVGVLGGAALSRKLLGWLSTQAWLRGGSFLADEGNGGLLGATLGLRVHSGEREVMPYLSVDAGGCMTGDLFRPWYGASVGVDWRVRDWMTLGPSAGFDQVIQWNKPTYSTDAIHFWLGLTVAYDRATPPPPPKKPVRHPVEPEPAPAQAPPVSDDGQLEALIAHALGPSAARLELLAPVLFKLDSDQIEPIGIAMLHEVLHALQTRPEIRLLEVQGYADARGSHEHNQDLSRRRAERVQAWLIAHGVSAERLVVAAEGATMPVEIDGSETAHEQNRRVVFRVLELVQP